MLVRINSHRAREKVERALRPIKLINLYNYWEGYFYEVPDDFDFSHIKGVRKCRAPKHELHECWIAEDYGILPYK